MLVPLLVAAAVPASVGVARAQSAGRAENPEADKFVAEGIELRARGKDNEALRAFQKAAEIDPDSVRVQIHLATVYQALGNWLLADEYLSMALARQNHPYVNRHRQTLEDAKRVIDANIGRLEIDGGPPGSEVRLSGRLVGTLPLAAPIRSTVGSFLLEVRHEGHYTSQRPITITGGGLVRESVQLEPLPADAAARALRASRAGSAPATSDGVDSGGGSSWVTWSLVGGAGVAGAVSVGALVFREVHAGRWNDNARCLEVERTRAEVCGDERDKANAAETVAVVGGALTGAFALGAVLNGLGVFASEAPPSEAGLRGCNLGIAGASCFGTF
ncbi:MAG TPA: tetratricopeptide repeat protein [Polyangiaceae bacterium]|nr:tetratricopeptide repeat protein [Polyangiaceae bacterium]